MTNEFDEVISHIQQEQGLSRELILKTVEESLLAAYKKLYDTDENAVVKFLDDGKPKVYARRTIVADREPADPVLEIPLEEALTYNENCEVGDELLIEIDLAQFSRGAVFAAKQRNRQSLRDIQKDVLYSEYKDKVGELILGYHQREKNGCIFVNLGKAEGVLPKRFQSPRETYRPGDRIRALIVDVKRESTGLQILLSRTDSNLVRRVLEVEVDEIYDSVVEIHKIVREAGYRTKVALFSHRDDVDPVGACIGPKGVRIQAVVRELEGEKIDVIRYDANPEAFIKSCLAPAQIDQVVILSYSRRQALVVVEEEQLSLAIGKLGLNVRLANRLSDWSIDVKTREQFNEMDVSQEDARRVGALFDNEDQEDSEPLVEFPGVTEATLALLRRHNVSDVDDFLAAADNNFEGWELSETEKQQLTTLGEEILEIGRDGGLSGDDELEIEYECPECGHAVAQNMLLCPGCGVGLDFGDDDQEDAGDL